MSKYSKNQKFIRINFTFLNARALKDPTINVSWALNGVRNLGSLTDYTNSFERDFFLFQELLDRLDPDENTGVNNVKKTMEMVRICVQFTYNYRKTYRFNG